MSHSPVLARVLTGACAIYAGRRRSQGLATSTTASVARERLKAGVQLLHVLVVALNALAPLVKLAAAFDCGQKGVGMLCLGDQSVCRRPANELSPLIRNDAILDCRFAKT